MVPQEIDNHPSRWFSNALLRLRFPRYGAAWRLWLFAFAWLSFITALAASASFKGIFPLDVRTNQHSPEIHATLELPIAGIAIEPFSAIATIIVGSPDYRSAAVSTFAWVFTVVAACSWFLSRKTFETLRARTLRCFGLACFATLGLAMYMCAAILAPLPSWSLEPTDDATIVADLHSHTLSSHDGIASLDENLAYHRARGYHVTAITEHYSDQQVPRFYCDDGRAIPNVICGVEVSAASRGIRRGFLLILGIRTDAALPYHLLNEDAGGELADRISQFVSHAHGAGGAVVALSYLLGPQDIELLAGAGVDAFEVANFGHPNISQEVTSALLAAQQSHRIALVASTDWHGWGSFGRTWTLFKTGNSTQTGQTRQVIEALRNRDPDRIIPVVSQVIGQPKPLNNILAPFTETIRYARELSTGRVVSWWVWTALVFAIARYLRGYGYRPARCIAAGALLVISVLLLVRGLGLIATWASEAAFVFPLQTGAYSCGLALVSFIAACAVSRHLKR